MAVLSAYDLWKTDPDPYGWQDAWEAAQQAAEDESLEAMINDYDPNEPQAAMAARLSSGRA